MTLQTLYQSGKEQLTKAELESPAFDAFCLFTHVFGMTRHELAVRGGGEAGAAQAARYLNLTARRAAREPLQYLLGAWEFMDMSLAVGEGVLIPREDTGVLVEEGVRFLREEGAVFSAQGQRPVVYDLCGGSGAVAIALQKNAPHAEVYCFELSDAAFPYLLKNISTHAPDVRPVRLDVLSALPPSDVPAPHLILSNPPYIPTADMDILMPEVLREPREALEGGADGMVFYRAIAEKWSGLLPKGGGVAVEIGIGQCDAVRRIFEERELSVARVLCDWGKIERVVSAQKI